MTQCSFIVGAVCDRAIFRAYSRKQRPIRICLGDAGCGAIFFYVCAPGSELARKRYLGRKMSRTAEVTRTAAAV
jgi:hypothetical protein